jgi:hypothetical protein
MSDQLVTALIATAIALLCTLLWGASIAFVFWDVSRRQMPGREQLAWLALSALLPLIGFSGYLFARLLDGWLSPGRQEAGGHARRFTALKRPEGLDEHLPTIAAAELGRATRPDLESLRIKSWQAPNYTYFLTVVAGPQRGQEYSSNHLPIRIGRGAQADTALNGDLGVSRQHAEIYERGGVVRIRDLKSTHGTWVNGYSIDDKSLDPGDKIKVGLSTLLFKMEEHR